MELRIAHFTDTHFQDDSERPLLGLDSEEQFYQALDKLEGLGARPDLLLVTGDLANDGHPGAYLKAKKAFETAERRLGCPVIATLGNHDDRQAFADAFLDGRKFAENERWDQDLRFGGYRLLVLDDKSPGTDSRGSFTPDQLAQLKAQLDAEPETPVVLAFHHPVVLTPLKLMDTMDFAPDSAEAFRQLVVGYPQMMGILNGHTHFNVLTSLGSIAVAVCAGAAFGLDPYAEGKMDFTDSMWFNLITLRDRSFLSNPVPVRLPTRALFRFEAGVSSHDDVHQAMGM